MKQRLNQFRTDLAKRRRKIDKLDEELLNLLNLRIRLVSETWALKREMGEKIRNLKREREMLQTLKSKNTGPLKDAELEEAFRAILRLCRRSLGYRQKRRRTI